MILLEWIEQQKEIESKATKGPWEYDIDENEIHAITRSDVSGDPWHICPPQNEDCLRKNGPFITESRNNYRKLLDALSLAIESLGRYENIPGLGRDDNSGYFADKTLAQIESLILGEKNGT